MGLYTREQIDDLLYKCDIVELIGKHLPLKKNGANYTACCPFHQEKTPSFSVSPTKQFFYCFGCRASGNAIGFLMDYHKLSFPESIEALAQYTNTPLPQKEVSNKTPDQQQNQQQKKKTYQALIDALNKSQAFFKEALLSPEAKRARHYLHRRGIDEAWANTFGLGFSYPDWDKLLNSVFKSDLKTGINAGLIIEKSPTRHYDRFRNRLMFPIRNRKGQVVGFGGRILNNENPKYLNSPETEVFQKQHLLYGLYESLNGTQKPDAYIIVEGYMDVIALAQAGFTNSVATLGTSTSEHHILQLFRITNKLFFCFDGDNAGQKAADRALFNTLPYLQEGREAQFVFLPKGDDPDSIIRREGPKAFQARLDNSIPISQLLQQQLSKDINLLTLDGRAHYIKRAQIPLERIPNNLYRQLLIEGLAEHAQIRTELIDPNTSTATPPTHSINQPSKKPYNQSFKQPFSQPFNQPFNQQKQYQKARYEKSSHSRPKIHPNALESKALNPKTLVDQIISILIQNPQSSKNLNLPSLIKEANLPHTELLCEIQQLFKDNPETSLAYLFGHFHQSKNGQQLAALAAQEYLLPHSSQTSELDDAVNQLEKLAIDLLLSKETQKSNPDQHKILALIQKKASFSQYKALAIEET